MALNNLQWLMCQKTQPTIFNDFLINFRHHIVKLNDHQILLPETVLAYKALKSANLKFENERVVKVTIRELTLSCTDSLKNYAPTVFHCFIHSKVPLVMEKNEMDFAYNKNNQANSSGIFYGCCSN